MTLQLEPGQPVRLRIDHGNWPFTIPAGTVGAVRELVDAGTPGAHNDEEDSVVVEFPQDRSSAPRAVAFGIPTINDYLEFAEPIA